MYSLQLRLRLFSELTGRIVAWLTLPMVLGTFVVVVLRYAFDVGWIWMQEGIMWIHAVVFMLASAYTLHHDGHVRVDVFYGPMSERRKACVNLLGTLLFLLPVAVFLIVESWDYVAASWAIREGSREAGGLPYPLVPLLKTLIPVTAATLVLQGIADLIGSGLVLLNRDRGGTGGPAASGTV
jgi:TRAP-type mannitol/chloroaromatic compound transport system permease small subunit